MKTRPLLRTAAVTLLLMLVSAVVLSCKQENVRKPGLDHPNLRRFKSHQINQIIIDAWEHVHLGRFESAALDFERLVKKNYVDDDILFGAGYTFFQLNNIIKARGYADEALRLNPDNFEALFLRAQIHLRQRNPKAAAGDIKILLALNITKPLVCGYYFTENDLATPEKLDRRKEETRKLGGL